MFPKPRVNLSIDFIHTILYIWNLLSSSFYLLHDPLLPSKPHNWKQNKTKTTAYFMTFYFIILQGSETCHNLYLVF